MSQAGVEILKSFSGAMAHSSRPCPRRSSDRRALQSLDRQDVPSLPTAGAGTAFFFVSVASARRGRDSTPRALCQVAAGRVMKLATQGTAARACWPQHLTGLHEANLGQAGSVNHAGRREQIRGLMGTSTDATLFYSVPIDDEGDTPE